MEGVQEFISNELNGEYVVKDDGLCGGKGVKVLPPLITPLELSATAGLW